MESIPHTTLQSTNLASAGYDPDSRTLEVRFHSGATWRYRDVAPHHYQNLITAPSPGAYFHRAIKNGHSAEPA